MTKAVYRSREDGDYDFVAAFSPEQCPPAAPDGSDWAAEVAEWINHEGGGAIVISGAELGRLPDVLSGDSEMAKLAERPT